MAIATGPIQDGVEGFFILDREVTMAQFEAFDLMHVRPRGAPNDSPVRNVTE